MAKEGLSIVLVDVAPLDAAVAAVQAVENVGEVVPVRCDVSKIAEVVALREKVLDQFGEVQLLLNNAGVSRPAPAFSLTKDLAEVQEGWAQVIGVNMQGIINVAQAFAPIMARQENASVIINTGSKQGLTNPPANAGYNVSKAAVKAFTEQREFASSPCD
jgi:NAD(P)-dependent dehydrogenase (short-subunit alcohol dehydrogenase family)